MNQPARAEGQPEARVYRIANWERFVKADMTKCRGPLLWVATPTSHDGLGFLEMMTHPDGIRMYGAWHLILQTAAKCPQRGLLVTDGGRPIGAREIALRTRAPEDVIQQTFDFCERIGWLVASGRRPDTIPTTRQDKTRQDNQDRRPSGAEADSIGPTFATRQGVWRMTIGLRQTLVDGFASLDVDAEIGKAAAWCATARAKKSARGMPKFLYGWLNRCLPSAAPEACERPSAEAIAEARRIDAALKKQGK